jgi:hypothetical protein
MSLNERAAAWHLGCGARLNDPSAFAAAGGTFYLKQKSWGFFGAGGGPIRVGERGA